jgi:hypothetical protein
LGFSDFAMGTVCVTLVTIAPANLIWVPGCLQPGVSTGGVGTAPEGEEPAADGAAPTAPGGLEVHEVHDTGA